MRICATLSIHYERISAFIDFTHYARVNYNCYPLLSITLTNILCVQMINIRERFTSKKHIIHSMFRCIYLRCNYKENGNGIELKFERIDKKDFFSNVYLPNMYIEVEFSVFGKKGFKIRAVLQDYNK